MSVIEHMTVHPTFIHKLVVCSALIWMLVTAIGCDRKAKQMKRGFEDVNRRGIEIENAAKPD